MGRIYSEELYDLPRVQIPDWELLARLEELVRPYFGIWGGTPPSIWFAEDHRGHYDAPNLEQFRRDVEAQEQPPRTVRLMFRKPVALPSETQFFVSVYTSNFIGVGGRVESTDEVLVNHTAARIRDHFDAAALRLPPRPKPAAKRLPQARPVPPRIQALALASAHVLALVVAITGTVVGGAILFWLFGA